MTDKKEMIERIYSLVEYAFKNKSNDIWFQYMQIYIPQTISRYCFEGWHDSVITFLNACEEVKVEGVQSYEWQGFREDVLRFLRPELLSTAINLFEDEYIGGYTSKKEYLRYLPILLEVLMKVNPLYGFKWVEYFVRDIDLDVAKVALGVLIEYAEEKKAEIDDRIEGAT